MNDANHPPETPETRFDRLMRQYEKRLSRTIGTFGVWLDDLEDVVQEVRLKVWRYLRAGKPVNPASEWLWLRRVAENTTNDYKRMRGRHAQAFEADRRRAELWPPTDLPMDSVWGGRHGEWIKEAEEKLTPEDARTLRRHFVEGWRYSDFAKEWGISESGARARIRRILVKMREYLGESDEDSGP